MARRNLSAYDNKLVASTLSHPSGATPSGSSAAGPGAPGESATLNTSPIAAVFPALHHVASSGSFVSAAHTSPNPGGANLFPSSSYGLGLPVTRSLSSMTSSSVGTGVGAQPRPSIGAVMDANSHPSHPTSPWSVLTLHILPVFNGVPLGGSIEDLNILAETHIKSCRTRSPRLYRRLVSSDLQELVSTGMLTVSAKLEETTVREDPQRLIARMAEVWGFFWGLLPTLQGVFLPISLLANEEQGDTQGPDAPFSSTPNVRRLLLSGFLLHILLPILPLLIDALDPAHYTSARPPTTPSDDAPPTPSSPNPDQPAPLPLPTSDHLARIKHMSLILSTQARGSDFFTLFEQGRVGNDEGDDLDPGQRDLYNRYAVQNLLQAVAALKQQGHYQAGPGGSPLSATGGAFSSDTTGRRAKSGYPASVFRDRSDSGWGQHGPPPRGRTLQPTAEDDDAESLHRPVGRFDRRYSMDSEGEAYSEGGGDSGEFGRSGTLTPGALEDPATRRPSAISQETMDARRGGRV